MKKTFISLLMAVAMMASSTAVAFADDKKEDKKAKTECCEKKAECEKKKEGCCKDKAEKKEGCCKDKKGKECAEKTSSGKK